jgi:putative transport protein
VLGLVCGWLRSVYLVFVRIPEFTQWVLESVRLHTFIAVVGLRVGPSFITGLLHMGPGLFGTGIIVTLVPHTVTLCIGYYCLQQHLRRVAGRLRWW